MSGLFDWLFGSQKAASPTGPVVLDGDGTFDQEIVGESFYQDTLEALFGPKTEDAVQIATNARLVCELNNPHDSNAVAVMMKGQKVGHLSRADAVAYRRELRSLFGHREPEAIVDALVVGGWSRANGSEGSFGVRLDLDWPLSARNR